VQRIFNYDKIQDDIPSSDKVQNSVMYGLQLHHHIHEL